MPYSSYQLKDKNYYLRKLSPKFKILDLQNKLFNVDCMKFMPTIPDKTFNTTLTDIPYEIPSKFLKHSIRRYDKINSANIINFSIKRFVSQLIRLTTNNIIIFCGKNQFSEIFNTFIAKGYTTKQLIWIKSNPIPFKQNKIFLNGYENIIYVKLQSKAPFNLPHHLDNLHNGVFNYSVGKRTDILLRDKNGVLIEIHPTLKPLNLLSELIEISSNPGDLIFDPCAGGASTLIAAHKLNRKWIGCEIDRGYYELSLQRLKVHDIL